MDLDRLAAAGFQDVSAIEKLYEQYSANPISLDPSWRKIFGGWGLDAQPNLENQGQVDDLIDAYRLHGHLVAHINPLEEKPVKEANELHLNHYNLSEKDLPRLFPTEGLLPETHASLDAIIKRLKEIYCDKIGFQYFGLENDELVDWIKTRLETGNLREGLDAGQKKTILERLNRSELLEAFLHTKFIGQKRFSLEGGESLIPMIWEIIETGAGLGMEECVIGMAHRGRLNVLSNILNKSYATIFSEFDESYVPASFEGSGDVKYHKGYYAQIATKAGASIKIDLSPNPSHLEAVYPVVEGMVRAKQRLADDEIDRRKVVPLLIHGDAAISGQGVVYETMQMYKLKGYEVGGSVHIVINNQIGFTTAPEDTRSTRYCSDIAKAFDLPVFHVNVEDPEGCVLAARLAIEIRQAFHCDVIIDVNCYRKYGHNEGDEPSFTQPHEYKIIKNKQPIRELYKNALIQAEILSKQDAEKLETDFKAILNQAFENTKSGGKAKKQVSLDELNNEQDCQKTFTVTHSSVSSDLLKDIASMLCAIPEGFQIHPKVRALMQERNASVNESGKPIDWGTAEMLAYGTLLHEGKSIRLTGQDCCRGTFSHRHAVWMDQSDTDSYCPYQHLKGSQGRFDIFNSHLSENAALGFEFGYSEANPEALVIWEAQFGDFANGAQVVIDQFIACSEQKWGLRSGLVLFLPHGYEGQGPEHSSARIERYLTLAGHCNLRIVYPTTPAQFFHLLRKQALCPERKPLIIFTPKGLLRHPQAVNTLADFTKGNFNEILDDQEEIQEPTKLAFCSGKIYYDLSAERKRLQNKNVSIVRIEQLYPLDEKKLKEIARKYSKAEEYFWVQDEPENMGAWHFILPYLKKTFNDKNIIYIGRSQSATTAVGSLVLHKLEQQAIFKALFK